ncbi:MAG TPA: PEP-CTERM sorting domain-containing protein [Phycisphaerae bacterium]|nr:PEP-CTERM sorting domain-containing protein [Phycisphaerae bacterium]
MFVRRAFSDQRRRMVRRREGCCCRDGARPATAANVTHAGGFTFPAYRSGRCQGGTCPVHGDKPAGIRTMKTEMRFYLLGALVASGLLAMPTVASGDVITYDFADGTMQGWTVVKSDASLTFLASKQGEHGNTEPWGGSDDYYMSEVNFSNRGASPHDTLLVRSPEFVLSGADGDLSMRTYGGVDGDNLPTSVSDLASSTSAGDGVHALGMGLREVGADNYLLTAASGGHNSPFIISFSQAQLAPLAGRTVTVDVFDSTSNGWGWVVFDDVVVPAIVPEPMTMSLLVLGGGLALLRRRT